MACAAGAAHPCTDRLPFAFAASHDPALHRTPFGRWRAVDHRVRTRPWCDACASGHRSAGRHRHHAADDRCPRRPGARQACCATAVLPARGGTARPARSRDRGGRSCRTQARRRSHTRRPSELRPGERHRPRDGHMFESRRKATASAGPRRRSASTASRASSSSRASSIGRTGAGGTAARVDFLDADRAVALAATYTSCPADGSGDPAWLLSARPRAAQFRDQRGHRRRCRAAIPGRADPRRADDELPAERRSASRDGCRRSSALDSSSGFVVGSALLLEHRAEPRRDDHAGVPHAPRARRSTANSATSSPRTAASCGSTCCRSDRQTGTTRYAFDLAHDGSPGAPIGSFQLHSLRVSDDNYWKDFPDAATSLTRRLLTTDLQAQRTLAGLPGGGDWTVFAGVQAWQALQGTEPSSLMEVALPAPARRSACAPTRPCGDGFDGVLRDRVQPVHRTRRA